VSDFSEADTRAKLIDRAISARGWTEDFIKREESAGAVKIVAGKARRHAKGRTDYPLRIQANSETQRVAVALFETKEASLPPNHVLNQAKGYGRSSLPAGVFTAAEAGVKTNLLFFAKGQPTERIWYYDLSDVKVGKKTPLSLNASDGIFELSPTRGDSERSWTVDLDDRKAQAASDAQPFKEDARQKSEEADEQRERLATLKKEKCRNATGLSEAESQLKLLAREAREAASKAEAIENAVYDFKAVNLHRKALVDIRTPEQLLDIIEAKGREIAEAVAELRKEEVPT
jgi:type I restriction-modification system DNA methylase subunit